MTIFANPNFCLCVLKNCPLCVMLRAIQPERDNPIAETKPMAMAESTPVKSAIASDGQSMEFVN